MQLIERWIVTAVVILQFNRALSQLVKSSTTKDERNVIYLNNFLPKIMTTNAKNLQKNVLASKTQLKEIFPPKSNIRVNFKSSEPKNHQYSYTDPITGTYQFGYRMNNQYREEEKRANGVTLGRYGWMDQSGKWHHTTFISDKNGYRVIPSIPPPPVSHPTGFLSNKPTPPMNPLLFDALRNDFFQDQDYNYQNLGPYRPGIKTPYHSNPILNMDGLNTESHNEITEANLQDNFFNKFPLKGDKDNQGTKVFPAKVQKISNPNKIYQSLTNIRKKFDATTPAPAKPVVIEEPSSSTGDDWWDTLSETAESSNIVNTIHDGVPPGVHFKPDGFKPPLPYRNPQPVGQNIGPSSSLLKPNNPPQPPSYDNMDYLLLSDEFNVVDGSITKDPAYVNIQQFQQEIQDDDDNRVVLIKKPEKTNNINNSHEGVIKVNKNPNHGLSGPDSNVPNNPDLLSVSSKPDKPLIVKPPTKPPRIQRPNPMLFLNQLLKSIFTPNRNRYRFNLPGNNVYYE